LYKPSSKATHFDLPADFYKLKVEEIKKEMKARYFTSKDIYEVLVVDIFLAVP